MGPLQEDGITLILSEFAVEQHGVKGWVRNSHSFYKRRPAPEARMPLASVPNMDDAVRQMLRDELWRQTALVSQSDLGTTHI